MNSPLFSPFGFPDEKKMPRQSSFQREFFLATELLLIYSFWGVFSHPPEAHGIKAACGVEPRRWATDTQTFDVLVY